LLGSSGDETLLGSSGDDKMDVNASTLQMLNQAYVEQGVSGVVDFIKPKIQSWVKELRENPKAAKRAETNIREFVASIAADYVDPQTGEPRLTGPVLDVATSFGPLGVGLGIIRRIGRSQIKLSDDVLVRAAANSNRGTLRDVTHVISKADAKKVAQLRKKRLTRRDGSRVDLSNMSDSDILRSIKPVSLKKAFGSAELNAAEKAGAKFTEKPSYLSDIKVGLSNKDVVKIENEIGYKLNSYKLSDVVEKYKGKVYPQGDLNIGALKNDDQMFILWDPPTNSRYLVDRSGATSYIRNWAKIGE